jgi:hypothetical protein
MKYSKYINFWSMDARFKPVRYAGNCLLTVYVIPIILLCCLLGILSINDLDPDLFMTQHLFWFLFGYCLLLFLTFFLYIKELGG